MPSIRVVTADVQRLWIAWKVWKLAERGGPTLECGHPRSRPMRRRSPGRIGGPGGTLCGSSRPAVGRFPAARGSSRKPIALARSLRRGTTARSYSVSAWKSPGRKESASPIRAAT
jgi:hypothetical protein